MRNPLRVVTTAFLLLVTTATLCQATPVPMLDLAALCKHSDLIVVGQIEDVQRIGEMQMEVRGLWVSVLRMRARMKAEYAIKGQPTGGTVSFDFVLPQPESLGYRGLPRSYRMVFLKSAGVQWELANPFYPSFAAVPGKRVLTQNVFTSVVSTLGAALNAERLSPDDQVSLVWVLGTVPTSEATNALLQAAKNTDLRVRLHAVSTLLERNETRVLPAAVKVLSHPDGIPEDLIQNVAAGIARGVKDPSSIPYLADLLRNPDVRVRRSAGVALRNVGTSRAARELGFALHDSDLKVRYYAVIGIADITGESGWRPLMPEYQEHEDKYLSHWKAWASANSHSIRAE